MKTLAEHLGVVDPKQPDQPRADAPSLKMTAKEFARGVLHTSTYRESILQRVLLGTLPPAVECLLYHYAYGKPVEKLEVKDTTDPLDDFTAEQCEERAQKLLELARQLRVRSVESDDTPVVEAVH